MNRLIIASLLVLYSTTFAADKKNVTDDRGEPGYDISADTRDPFITVVSQKTQLSQDGYKDGQVANNSQSMKMELFGAMKGAEGQTIGVFNFGVLAVGKSKKVTINGKQVEVSLKGLDMKIMDAELMIDKKIVHITKNGGAK